MSGRVTRDGRAAWTGLAIDFNDHRLGDWGAHGINALVFVSRDGQSQSQTLSHVLTRTSHSRTWAPLAHTYNMYVT